MAELPQRLGLPEKPHFGPAGWLETSAEALGRWERQQGDVMEELRADRAGAGGAFEGEQGRPAKGPVWTQPQQLAGVQRRVCLPGP